MNMNRAINMIFIRPLVAFALAALLIVATCLSVAAPALAQEGERWETTCRTDDWGDVFCTAVSPDTRSSRKLEFNFSNAGRKSIAAPSIAMYRCAKKVDGTKEEFYQLGFLYGNSISLGNTETDSEGRTFYNVPMRWDDEPPVKSAFFWRREEQKDGDFGYYGTLGLGYLVWKNPSQAARQFRARDKLRIRPSMGGRLAPAPTAFTYSLLGAAEAIGEAARKCGF